MKQSGRVITERGLEVDFDNKREFEQIKVRSGFQSGKHEQRHEHEKTWAHSHSKI